MTAEEILKLRSAGLSYFKDRDVELRFEVSSPIEIKAETAPIAKEILPEPILEEKEVIKHRMELMGSLLKLDDKDLVDRLFPDHTQEGAAEESAHDN